MNRTKARLARALVRMVRAEQDLCAEIAEMNRDQIAEEPHGQQLVPRFADILTATMAARLVSRPEVHVSARDLRLAAFHLVLSLYQIEPRLNIVESASRLPQPNGGTFHPLWKPPSPPATQRVKRCLQLLLEALARLKAEALADETLFWPTESSGVEDYPDAGHTEIVAVISELLYEPEPRICANDIRDLACALLLCADRASKGGPRTSMVE